MHSAGPAGASRPRSVLFASRGSAGRRLPARSGAGVAAYHTGPPCARVETPAPSGAGALARPCAGRPAVVTLALRRRTAPRSGARVGTPLAAPRAARHRWAGANCRMTGLRQFAPACLECPLLYAGTFGLRPRAGVGHFDGPRTFQVHPSPAPARGKARRGRRPGTALPGPGPSCHPGNVCSISEGTASTAKTSAAQPLTPSPPICCEQTSGRRAPVPNARPLQFWR